MLLLMMLDDRTTDLFKGWMHIISNKTSVLLFLNYGELFTYHTTHHWTNQRLDTLCKVSEPECWCRWRPREREPKWKVWGLAPSGVQERNNRPGLCTTETDDISNTGRLDSAWPAYQIITCATVEVACWSVRTAQPAKYVTFDWVSFAVTFGFSDYK